MCVAPDLETWRARHGADMLSTPSMTESSLVRQPQPRAISTRTCGVCIAESWSRSEEHTSELQSLMRISYAVFCLKQKRRHNHEKHTERHQKPTKQHNNKI